METVVSKKKIVLIVLVVLIILVLATIAEYFTLEKSSNNSINVERARSKEQTK